MKLFVKGPDGTQKIINMESTASLEEFKVAAEETFQTTVEWVMFGGKTLSDDDKTLGEYNIKNNSHLQIAAKARGGELNYS